MQQNVAVLSCHCWHITHIRTHYEKNMISFTKLKVPVHNLLHCWKETWPQSTQKKFAKFCLIVFGMSEWTDRQIYILITTLHTNPGGKIIRNSADAEKMWHASHWMQRLLAQTLKLHISWYPTRLPQKNLGSQDIMIWVRFSMQAVKTPTYPVMWRFTLFVALGDHNPPWPTTLDRRTSR